MCAFGIDVAQQLGAVASEVEGVWRPHVRSEQAVADSEDSVLDEACLIVAEEHCVEQLDREKYDCQSAAPVE